jgi:hypothetical protein
MDAKIGFTVLYCLLFAAASAQDWEYFQVTGGPGEDAFSAMDILEDGTLLVSGVYNQAFEWGGFSLPGYGDDDVLLARLDTSGQPLWVLPGGSADGDYADALAVLPGGGAAWGGVFWETLQAGDWEGIAPEGGRALFLLSVSPEGIPQWGKVMHGQGPKGLRDVVADPDGNIYVAGYFGGFLAMEDTLLQAQGERDGFVAKWDVEGNFQWVLRFGESGSVRAECLAIRNTAQLYLGGRFNGAISLAGKTIQANTLDDDGFVAAVSASGGEPLWLNKAGAQYDDAVNALAVNDVNELFATGTFVGVLQVAEGWTLTTAGFNTNFFLIRYNALDGTPEWAQSLGNGTDEQGLALGIRNEGPVVAGLFRQSLSLEGQSVSAKGEGFNGFAAGFRPGGSLRWLTGFPGDGLVIPEGVAVAGDGTVWVCGGFSGNIWFDETVVASDGFYDAWIGRLSETAAAVYESPPPGFTGKVFPNPVSDIFFVEGISIPFTYRLSGADGRLIREGKSEGEISVNALPPGLYWLQVWDPARKAWQGISIKKL